MTCTLERKPGRMAMLRIEPVTFGLEELHGDDQGRVFIVHTSALFHRLGKPSCFVVTIAHDGNHACECKRFCRRGRCPHVGALTALHRRGKL